MELRRANRAPTRARIFTIFKAESSQLEPRIKHKAKVHLCLGLEVDSSRAGWGLVGSRRSLKDRNHEEHAGQYGSQRTQPHESHTITPASTCTVTQSGPALNISVRTPTRHGNNPSSPKTEYGHLRFTYFNCFVIYQTVDRFVVGFVVERVHFHTEFGSKKHRNHNRTCVQNSKSNKEEKYCY